MFNPSRDEVRQFFRDTWRRHRAGEILDGMTAMVAAIIVEHPEYHALLEDEDAEPPANGGHNPFLHLSMHLTIEEQLAIDQPPGVRARYARLLARSDTDHAAQHRMMDCLGEMLWRAQRDGAPPDGDAYLDCLGRQGG